MANTAKKTLGKENLLQIIINALSEKKAKDIVSLDLRDIKVAIADYFVVAHGDSNTQVNALHQTVLKTARDNGYRAYHDEGKQNGEWIIIDFIDIVVHIFHREKRDFYQLEDLWHDAPSTKYAEDGNAKESKKANTKTKNKIVEHTIDDKPYVDKYAIAKAPRKSYAKKGVSNSAPSKRDKKSIDDVVEPSSLNSTRSAIKKAPRKSFEENTSLKSESSKRSKKTSEEGSVSKVLKPSKSNKVAMKKPTAKKSTKPSTKSVVEKKISKKTKS